MASTLNGPPPAGAAHAGATAEKLAADKAKYGALSVFNPATATTKGRAAVGGAFSLWYEVHGTGPEKVVLIMGLDGTSSSWLAQVEHLVALPKYSCLVLDNRGYGNSDSPHSRYTSHALAGDVLALLDHVGWTGRCVHVVGVSMGGMVALELARRAGERILSLTLMSTMARLRYASPLRTLLTMQRIGVGRAMGVLDSDEAQIDALIRISFPLPWLDAPSTSDAARTNRQVLREIMVWRYRAVTRPTGTGALSYVLAVSTHNVSPAALASIDAAIPRITILTGDCDAVLDARHSSDMAAHMPHAKLVVFAGNGHAIQLQSPEQLTNLLRETFEAGAALALGGHTA